MTGYKVFGSISTTLGFIWFVFDVFSRTVLFPSDAHMAPGTVLGFSLSIACILMGLCLIRNERLKWVRITSISLFVIFLLDVAANLYIISIR